MNYGGNAKNTASVWDQAWRENALPPDDHHDLIVSTLTRFSDKLAGKRILEAGAGTARDSLTLAKMSANCVALDISAMALSIAQQGAQHRSINIDLVQGDILKLPFSSSMFDIVFSQGVIEHFSDPKPVLYEQIRMLCPGGLLLVEVPQTLNIYTLQKKWLIRSGRWFAGWETSYTLKKLERLLHTLPLEVVGAYGSGYYPDFLQGLRNLHTYDVRHNLERKIPALFRNSIDSLWQWFETHSWYYQFMWNIGVVARKTVQ